MTTIRLSTPTDEPAIRHLWALAFGDSGDYMDNFFNTYYRPERMIVLVEDGLVRSMTAWFDTTFTLAGGQEQRAAYLYAVATHPDCRGRGLAARVLAWADDYFRSVSIPAVTTVPASPSLHDFFAANGFRECFAHDELRAAPGAAAPAFALEPLSPAAYGQLREELLSGLPHITFPADALAYQAGCSVLSGGGLYAADTGAGMAALCAEGMEDGRLLLKELLGSEQARDALLPVLHRLLPAFSGVYRCPGARTPFGMLKWLDTSLAESWDWASTAYLGLAFD